MTLRNFLEWTCSPSATRRAEGASALAQAYLYSRLDESEQSQAENTLIVLADDASPRVRRALAEGFANAIDAPHALILALAHDHSHIAAPVLSRSPLLSEAELIDCAAIGDAYAQAAIATRNRIPGSLAAALAEIGAREAVILLALNPGAKLPEFSMRRMIERFGDDGEMREALANRPLLPAAIRCDLAAATAASLTASVVDCSWLSPERAKRLSREACEKANVIVAAEAAKRGGRRGLRELAAHLRISGRLTPSLILRALLSDRRDLFEAALAELSGLREDRVAGQLTDFRGAGFAALFAMAGLPAKLLPAYRAALEAHRKFERPSVKDDARLCRPMIEETIVACEKINRGELEGLLALLRRFEMEAALEQARSAAPLLAASKSEAEAPLIDIAAFEAALAEAA